MLKDNYGLGRNFSVDIQQNNESKAIKKLNREATKPYIADIDV